MLQRLSRPPSTALQPSPPVAFVGENMW